MICPPSAAPPFRPPLRVDSGSSVPARIIERGALNWTPVSGGNQVKTIDEMLSLHLLSSEQHAQISAWIADLRTPEAILQMPAHLWRALELASVLINFDADVTRTPTFGFD